SLLPSPFSLLPSPFSLLPSPFSLLPTSTPPRRTYNRQNPSYHEQPSTRRDCWLMTLTQALGKNFLGNSPDWYKATIVAFLIINPIVMLAGGSHGAVIAGWLLLLQFIFTLAMALKCYPLQPGGLLAIEAVLIGLTSPASVYNETVVALPVILLLIFMVAGIYFLKELLLFTFTKIVLGVRSQLLLSVMICLTAAALSAFLDALTVLAVLITVGLGFYQVFHRFASGKHHEADHDAGADEGV